MNFYIPKSKSEFIRHLRDPLFKNSLFIMLTSVSGAGFGFIFWILAAKLYSPEDVGIATALISSMGLLVLISRFGLDFSIIRFFPTNDKSRIFSTSIIITTFFAVIFGVIFITGVGIFLPKLYFLKQPMNAMLYLMILVVNSMTTLTDISYVAIRKARFQFIQSIIIGLRIFFLPLFVALGAFGIFGAFGISFMLALLASIILFTQSGIKLGLTIDYKFLNETFHYSTMNYLAGIFMIAPNMILPILVLNTLGSEEAAYYYIAFAIVSILFIIPNSIGISLFVEGSHGEALKQTVRKSLFAIFLILTPSAFFLYVCGEWMLNVIGTEYATGGLRVLQMMIIASFFGGFRSVYFAIKRIQKDVNGVLLLSAMIGGLLVSLSYVFMHMFGIVGVGYAWIMSYGIGALVTGIILWSGRWYEHT